MSSLSTAALPHAYSTIKVALVIYSTRFGFVTLYNKNTMLNDEISLSRIGDKVLLDRKTLRVVNEYVPGRDDLIALADFFSSLSDGTRLKILSALSISPMCVGDLSVILGINQTTVSHQLRILRSAGAVDFRRQGKITFYSIKNPRILDVMLSASKCI